MTPVEKKVRIAWTQVDAMSADKYFSYAAELLKVNSPHTTDQLADVPAAAQKLMKWKVATPARVVIGWSINTDTMGVYGNYYLKRAIVAQKGLGANLPDNFRRAADVVDMPKIL